MHQKITEFIGSNLRPIEFAEFVKKFLRIRRKVEDFGDFKMFIDPASNFGIRILKNRIYEQKTLDVLNEKLVEGDTFIDVGANEGYFSIIASRLVGASGKVVAIEPQNRLGAVIMENFKINRLYNASLLPYGVSDKRDKNEIVISPSINSGSSSLVQSSRSRHWKKESIYIETIDKLLGDHGVANVDLMKMDIEGFEVFALKGMHHLFTERRVKSLLLEFHPAQIKTLGSSIEELEDLLKNYGFKKSDRFHDLFTLH